MSPPPQKKREISTYYVHRIYTYISKTLKTQCHVNVILTKRFKINKMHLLKMLLKILKTFTVIDKSPFLFISKQKYSK